MREHVSDSSEASSSCESEYAGETSHVFDSIDQIDDDCGFSDIDVLGNSTIIFDNLRSGGSDDSEQKLPSMSNFLFCANAIIARHGTSDAAANNWFKLIRTAFPERTIPSYKTLKRNYHVVKDNEENFIRISGQGKRWQLDFVSELRNIVVSNILETFSLTYT